MIRAEDHIPLALAEADAFARACPRRRDDVEQEACLAVAAAAADWLGPDGGFADFARAAIRTALGRDRAREREARRDGPTGGDAPPPRGAPIAILALTPARAMTAGQRRRFRRDLAILAASRAGLSARWLAEVFDLPRSRIAAILSEMEASR